MTVLLSNEEKTGIINQHLRNLHYSKFNIEISLVQENARVQKETETIASLNAELADVDTRITALEAELDKLV
jgi:chromosome segregation ATPase